MYTFYCCALWTFLLLRILNSINYDCPCIHFIVAHYFIQYFANFFFTSIIHQSDHYFTFRELFTVVIDGSGPFAFRECHPSFHGSGLFRIPRISYIHLFIDQGFLLHFANIIHPSFSLIRAFCISRISYIHPFIDQGFSLHISRFIHPFLSLRINLFTFWALIY